VWDDIVKFIGAVCITTPNFMLTGQTVSSLYCYVVLCEGRLVLNMNKDTYMQLGLEGRPSKYSQKQIGRYVVNIDLVGAHFRPGKRNYQRVEWCFTDRLNLLFDFIIAWVPFGNE